MKDGIGNWEWELGYDRKQEAMRFDKTKINLNNQSKTKAKPKQSMNTKPGVVGGEMPFILRGILAKV